LTTLQNYVGHFFFLDKQTYRHITIKHALENEYIKILSSGHAKEAIYTVTFEL